MNNLAGLFGFQPVTHVLISSRHHPSMSYHGKTVTGLVQELHHSRTHKGEILLYFWFLTCSDGEIDVFSLSLSHSTFTLLISSVLQ